MNIKVKRKIKNKYLILIKCYGIDIKGMHG